MSYNHSIDVTNSSNLSLLSLFHFKVSSSSSTSRKKREASLQGEVLIFNLPISNFLSSSSSSSSLLLLLLLFMKNLLSFLWSLYISHMNYLEFWQNWINSLHPNSKFLTPTCSVLVGMCSPRYLGLV